MFNHRVRKILSFLSASLLGGAIILATGDICWIPLTAQGSIASIRQEIIALKASEKRWLEINLSTQRLIAWEGSQPVYAIIVSTGKKDTPTPSGIFAIQSKRRLDRMRGDDYDISNVPYSMYFYGGYAIHGTYWHNRFGTPVSHGCINVAVDHAQWLFEWADLNTPVIIHPSAERVLRP
jgi:lipoprotein-anchoring transpeptidase ErfK/SrfK